MPIKWGKRRVKSLNEIQPAYSFSVNTEQQLCCFADCMESG